MTFKQNWEKKELQLQLPMKTIKSMVTLAFPGKKFGTYKIISGGCANLNIKINLKEGESSYILRIYLRDKDAAYREQKLSDLLKPNIPLPHIYFIGDYNNYRFAITEYISGITLRELLLGNEPYDLSAIMFEVGQLLARIQSHHFRTAGFFDTHLNIAEKTSQDGLLAFAKNCLESPTIINALNADDLSKISYYLETHKNCFPDENEKHLVHADYDPANILVDKLNGQWKISGILDWEFSFSGTPLWDVANMLRYAHQMPAQFEASFIKGLQEDYTLPKHWRISINPLNLVSLLDCLIRVSLVESPNACEDICRLIQHITATGDKI